MRRMSGYRDRMGVGRCCCECEDCCNGSYAPEWDVEITLADQHCEICDTTLSGVYTLSNSFPAGSSALCRWGYLGPESSPFPPYDAICKPAGPYGIPYAWGIIGRGLFFRVTCVSATQYLLHVWYEIYARSLGGVVFLSQQIHWQKYIDVADFSCTGTIDYCIPFAFSYVGSGTGNDWRPWTGPSDVLTPLCNPEGSEACVTAVP